MLSSRIAQRVLAHDNDYSALEAAYLRQTGCVLVTPELQPQGHARLSQALSIVMPSHGSHAWLARTVEQLNRQSYGRFELVLVDDGSEPELLPCLVRAGPTFEVKYVRQSVNRGIAATRNTGLAVAEGAAVLILDDDLIFGPHFVAELALRLEVVPEGLFVGFREKAYTEAELSSRPPDYRRDWRASMQAEAHYHVSSLAASAPAGREALRHYDFLAETEAFRTFGRGRVLGYHDLCGMVVGHTVGFRREPAIRGGGFCEEFVGWGGEDLAFGALMIALGHYVIPSLSTTSWTLEKRAEPHADAEKYRHFDENVARYRRYAATELGALTFPRRAVRRLGKVERIERFAWDG